MKKKEVQSNDWAASSNVVVEITSLSGHLASVQLNGLLKTPAVNFTNILWCAARALVTLTKRTQLLWEEDELGTSRIIELMNAATERRVVTAIKLANTVRTSAFAKLTFDRWILGIVPPLFASDDYPGDERQLCLGTTANQQTATTQGRLKHRCNTLPEDGRVATPKEGTAPSLPRQIGITGRVLMNFQEAWQEYTRLRSLQATRAIARIQLTSWQDRRKCRAIRAAWALHLMQKSGQYRLRSCEGCGHHPGKNTCECCRVAWCDSCSNETNVAGNTTGIQHYKKRTTNP